MTDHQEPSHPQFFSEGYHAAMEKIDLEFLQRDPRYRDPYHHNWDLFGSPCPIRERHGAIINTICCSVLRSSAILAHLILGTRDPDRVHESSDWRDPTTRLLNAILYVTPIHYIDNQNCIWFYLHDFDPTPGYQVSHKTIRLMMDFADVADALAFSTAAEGRF